jgi:hypothetical protein
MTGFLEGYGAGEEKRERAMKRAALALLILLVAAASAYFLFRNYRQDRQLDRFLALLAVNDYAGAYRLWGCTETNPCRDYSMEKFLEDWGPASPHADAAAARVTRTRSCSAGVIKTVRFPTGDVLLWVDRRDLTLAFSPWPACNPHFAAPPAP